MPRPCSACSHPRAQEVAKDLAAGLTLTEVSRRWKISDSALRRHVHAHVSASILQELRANEHLGSPDLIERLVEALEDTSLVRASALLAGQSNVVLRAAATTESLVTALMDRLGVDNTEVTKLLAEGERLARAVGQATRRDPRVGQVIAAELRADNETDHDMADQLDLIASSVLTARPVEQC